MATIRLSRSNTTVAAGVAFLATPGASYVTGTTLIIDGGNAMCGATPRSDVLAEVDASERKFE